MHYVKAKSILSHKNGMNLYRGCLHGCIYCDSRSTCYHMEHAFEDIEVKENALELLEKALRSKRRKCMIGMGSMTDPYIPPEAELLYTRRAAELIYRYGFGFTLITKSDLILRDIELLKKINEETKCVVQITLTTADEELCRKIEPNTCTTARRFEVLMRLRDEGIPAVVWLSPVLPFINDTEENIRSILDMCIKARVKGIICFGMGVTLREGNRGYFYHQLDRLFPKMKERYIKTFGESYDAVSPDNSYLMKIFHEECEKNGIMHDNNEIFQYLSEFTEKDAAEQLSVWDL